MIGVPRLFPLLWLITVLAWICFVPRSTFNLEFLLSPPHFPESPFGRDAFGRSLAGALGEAMGRSLVFSFSATMAAVVTGLTAGASLGMIEGRIRFYSERVLDFFLAFPPMLLALAVQAAIGTGWRVLAFSISFGLFPGVVRFVAARAKGVSVEDFVGAAIALGGSRFSIFYRHYLPELLEHIRLKFPSLLAQALLLETTLSFLNLGVPAGTLSWGSLLAQAKDYLVEAPHIAWVVGVPLVLTLLSLQYLVDEMSQLGKRTPRKF